MIGLYLTWASQAVASGFLPADHPLRVLPADAVAARAVIDLARAGDLTSRALVERVSAMLARVAGLFGSLHSPERIIVVRRSGGPAVRRSGGPAVRRSGGPAPGVEEMLTVGRRLLPDELDLPAPELMTPSLGADVVSIGAVAAALESPRYCAFHIGWASMPHSPASPRGGRSDPRDKEVGLRVCRG